jgi:hypothetical protein
MQFLVVFYGHPFVTCACEFNEFKEVGLPFFRGEYFCGSEEFSFFNVAAV